MDLRFDALRGLGYENDRCARIDLLGTEGDSDHSEAMIARLSGERPKVVIALRDSPIATPRSVQNGSSSWPMRHPGWGRRRPLQLVIRGKRHPVRRRPRIRLDAAHRDLLAQADGLADLPRAFEDARLNGVQAVVSITDNLLFGYRKGTRRAGAREPPCLHALLSAAGRRLHVLRVQSRREHRRGAALVSRIRKTARPEDIRIEEPTRFTPVANMNTTKALGLTVPQSIGARSDEVIEYAPPMTACGTSPKCRIGGQRSGHQRNSDIRSSTRHYRL